MLSKYLIHLSDGTVKEYTREQIILNAKKQESLGFKPRYKLRSQNGVKSDFPAGWLIWSTWKDGCGVVYKKSDETYDILIGRQGDFNYI